MDSQQCAIKARAYQSGERSLVGPFSSLCQTPQVHQKLENSQMESFEKEIHSGNAVT